MDRREQCMSVHMSEWGCHVGASYELTVDDGLLTTNYKYIEYKVNTHLSFVKKNIFPSFSSARFRLFLLMYSSVDMIQLIFAICTSFCLGYV